MNSRWDGVGMKIEKLLIIFLVVLLAVPFVAASSATVSAVNETANQIYFDEVAYYDLTITNTQDQDQVFVWSTNTVEWLIDTPSSTTVPAGETKTVPLSLRPRPSNYRGPGFYVVPLSMNGNIDDFTTQMSIRIKNVEDRIFSYIPSVALGVSMTDPVNPQELVSVQVQIRNRNILEIEELSIQIDGQEFEGSDTIMLGGLQERTLEYRFDVDDALEPGAYELTAQLIYQGEVISEDQQFYDVSSVSQIARDTDEQKAFFKTTTISMLMNNGNIQRTISTNTSIPWYESLFTSVDINADTYERQSRGIYQITIDPQETVSITIVKNYRSLLALAIVVLLIIISYFSFRSPIVMTKQTIVTGKDEEGVSEMRVRVFIRNRTAKPQYNVRIIDRAPSIAHVIAKGGLGVIEPSKVITTQKRGTIIKWDFESLEAYEERIVTYTIKARLKIIGHLGLPRVQAKFENQKGKQRTTQSGKAQVGSR